MAAEIKAMSDEALKKKLEEMKEEVQRREEAKIPPSSGTRDDGRSSA